MKKLIILFIAVAAMAMCGEARVIKNPRPVGGQGNSIAPPEAKRSINHRSRFGVVNEMPEGQLKVYQRSGQAVYMSQGNFYMGYQTGQLKIVFADDGKVYLENIFYNSGDYYGNYWVEGYLNDDGTRIIIPLGQSIYWSDHYGADIVLVWGRTYIDDGNFLFEKDDSVTQVTYTIDGDTIYGPEGGIAPVEDPQNPYWNYCATGLGCCWTDDDSFGGYLEWETVFTLTESGQPPRVITEQPEGTLHSYLRQCGFIYDSVYDNYQVTTQSGDLNVVFADDGKVYIQNPLLYHEDLNTWVEGTYDPSYGIISIPTGQYLSWDDDMQKGIQLVWGSTYVYARDDDGGDGYVYNLGYEVSPDVGYIYFSVQDNEISLLDSRGDPNSDFPDNYDVTGMMGIYSDDLHMTAIEFNTTGTIIDDAHPAIPMDPYIYEWYDSGSEDGYSYLGFELPQVDVNGNPLNEKNLSYSVYVDGKLFVFEANTYSYDLLQDVTEIPYSVWNSGWDFYPQKINFYRTNYCDNPLFNYWIGLQVHYTAGGQLNSSDIVKYYLNVTGTAEALTDKTVETVHYFNAMGQQVTEPQGVTIELTTYSDGTTAHRKVVK